jgi:uncharacterized membrane protein YbaN (DUF454 family)
MWQLKTFMVEWKIKRTKGHSYMALGGFFLLIALIGVFLPIIPQVPFAIISAYFFSKGSTTIHLWMRHNKFFGTPVREWEDFRVIRPKMKVIAVLSLIAGAFIGHMKMDLEYAWVLDAIFAVAIMFILTRKSRILSF